MIPRAHITAWRSRVAWAEDWQVEQDLVISRALVDIFTDPLLQEKLAFRGGTALHKLHLQPAQRYSEDIDLVRTDAGAIKPIIHALRERLQPWLGKASYEGKSRSSTLKFRFDSEGTPRVRLGLKVEINVRETTAYDGHRRVPFAVDSEWFSGTTEILTFSLEELLATKLRALYERSAGRDAFDLDRALRHVPAPDPVKIVELFRRYTAADGREISRAQFERNLHGKRASPDFASDIVPLLAAEASEYDVQVALDRISERLVSLLPGLPWAGERTP